jgi:pilus assembly protein CpaB
MAAKPKQVFVIGAIAVLIAAVASYLLYDYLKGQETKMKEAVATENVVVASQDLPVGTVINDTQVKAVGWPKTSMPQGSFAGTEQVVGRTVLDKVSTGEPVTAAKLVPAGGQTGILTYKIPEGHRAMTVAVDQVSGVAGFITPGNRVDVILSVTPPGGQQPLSKIVLQDVPVLAIGQIIAQEKKDEKPQVVPTVTMDVTPEDAEKLAVASTQGRLQLVLRRAGDTDVAKTAGSTVIRVLGGSSAPQRVERVERKAGSKRMIVRRAQPKKEVAVKTQTDEFINVTVIRGNEKPVEKTFKVEKQ